MLTYHCLDTSCRSDIPMVEPPNSLIGSIPIAIQRLPAGMNQFTVAHYSLNIFSEIPFYELSLYIRYLQMFSFDLNTHEISLF